ncbi:uncharacterized protein BDW70DRAFT_165200 [Aspergillus foveolatus]|uniref:uncharacterized protein n=1 Tax=Aspergillus foveolatus TaxID=210207 RepID=UPI003CCD62B4
MSPQGHNPRYLNRTEDSKIELVVPGDYPRNSPKASLISVEATAHVHLLENDPSGPADEPPGLLLGIKRIDTTTKIEPPKQLRLLHLSNNDHGMEFNTFLRCALEAYGLTEPQTKNTIFKFFDRFLALSEQSTFRGGRFSPVPASTKVRLPGHNGSKKEEEVRVNFIAIPYFLLHDLQRPPQRTTMSRTKVHWIQPLVQSGYHLDSSMARENQQAIRRLYSHIKQVIHVPRLWVLSIGHNFVATCSPTPLFDGQTLSSASPGITLRTIGGQTAFPPTVRITTPWGFVFCLERGKCGVWFEFLYRVQAMLSSVACEGTSIDTRNWIYILEVDGSTIDARRWRSLWEAHGDDNPLLAIIASPPPNPPPPREEPIELNASANSPSAQIPELRYPSVVSDTLKKLDKRVREHRERRSRTIATMQSNHAGSDDADGFGQYRHTDINNYLSPSYHRPPNPVRLRRRRYRSAVEHDNDHPYQYVDPYYSPPKFVLDAIGKQSRRGKEDGEGHGLAQRASGTAGVSQTDGPGAGVGSATQRDKERGQGRSLPIFKWPIGKKPSEEASSDTNDAASTRRMKSLLAYIHRHMLFHTDNAKFSSYFPPPTATSTAMLLNRTYNAIPLKTKSNVESQLLHLRDTHHVNNYILDLLRTFVRGISDFLDEFIAPDYECIVKGKVWAAVSAVLETFRFSGRTMTTNTKIDPITPLAYQTNILEEYHVNILAIPLDLYLRHVRTIREGLVGVESRAIPRSMVDAFIQIVILLVKAASEGERIVAGIEDSAEGLEGADVVERGEDSGGRTVDSGSLDANDLETLDEVPEGRNGDSDSLEEDSGSSDAKNPDSLEKSARDPEKSLDGPEWNSGSLQQGAGDPKNSLDHTEEDSASVEENFESPEKDTGSTDAKNPNPLEKRPNILEEKNPDTLEESSGSPRTNPENLKDPSPATGSPGPNTRSSSTDRSTDWLLDCGSETEGPKITPPPPRYDPSPGIDSLFARLDQARDECCAMFRSDEDKVSSAAVSGLGLIVARMLESVLKGHSTCKELPELNIGEVYATYTTALQLEARNRPSKNLLLDISLLREELETIIANINEQLKLVINLRTYSSGQAPDEDLLLIDTGNINFENLFTSPPPSPSSSTLDGTASNYEDFAPISLSSRAILQAIHADLQEQEEVFAELIKRANILERQIVQRVDIIQEDHGKAILVFTIVSVIFLPLSFVSSYMGMNTADIRNMELNQALFWQVALPVTVIVVALVLVGAYNARWLHGASGAGDETLASQQAMMLYSSNSGTCEALAHSVTVRLNIKSLSRCQIQVTNALKGKKPPKGEPDPWKLSVGHDNKQSQSDNGSSDVSEVFSDNNSESDSNTDPDLDSEDSDSYGDDADNNSLNDERQLPQEYYLAQTKSLDVSQLRQERYVDKT